MPITMKNVYEAYCLLGDDASAQEILELPGSPPKGSRVCSAKSISRTLPVILCPTSFFGNGFLGVCIFNLRKQFGSQEMTQFAGHTFEEPVPYEWHTAYDGEDQTLADELWGNLQLDIGAGLVALSEDYAKANDLLFAQRSPWQNDMDIYFLNELHGMRRLRNLRWAFFECRDEEPQLASSHHIKHCMETIRQDLMRFTNDIPRNAGTTAPLESGLD
ncbi:hypothetical protein N7G274_009739 [Stereocaulon virgatum]|uniref:Uncharacterized protein n=1 Tax=Stereocaulon virgatum TaxID=373712 RepID=A0ABR3ZY36_9LECA